MPDHPAVDVLRCPICGAPVALGSGDAATCPHCGAKRPIPEAHRELRRLARTEEASRLAAEALFARLDRPPWLVTKVLAATFDLPLLAFFVVYGIPLGLSSILLGLKVSLWIGGRLGYASEEDMPFWIATTVIVGILTVITAAPRALEHRTV